MSEKRNVSVELSNRECWLLRGCLEGSIKEMKEGDGAIKAPGELEELQDLLDKVFEALLASGG